MSLGAWIVTDDDTSVLALTPITNLLERRLEDWVLHRPEVAMAGVVWIARQLILGSGRLDLLGLTPQVDARAAEAAAGDPIARALAQEIEGTVTATASELLALIEHERPGAHAGRAWPKRGQGMSDYLRRHAPSWRAQGWQVDEGYDPGRKVKQWTLTPPGGVHGVDGEDGPPHT